RSTTSVQHSIRGPTIPAPARPTTGWSPCATPGSAESTQPGRSGRQSSRPGARAGHPGRRTRRYLGSVATRSSPAARDNGQPTDLRQPGRDPQRGPACPGQAGAAVMPAGFDKTTRSVKLPFAFGELVYHRAADEKNAGMVTGYQIGEGFLV